MKKPVNDALVAEYVKRLGSGGPVGEVFPYQLHECDFTMQQKARIAAGHTARQKILNKIKSQPTTSPQKTTKSAAPKPTAVAKPAAKPAPPKPVAPAPAPKTAAPRPKLATPVQSPAPRSEGLKKLERMFYLQHEKCFFCGEKLALAEANIEHLHPLSKGGQRTEDNEVVCHKTLNETFGDLPLKQKFEFVLKAAGSFRCPKK